MLGKDTALWTELEGADQGHARALGWDAASWDAALEPLSYAVAWPKLGPDRRAAAEALGYEEDDWAGDGSDDEEDEDDIGEEAADEEGRGDEEERDDEDEDEEPAAESEEEEDAEGGGGGEEEEDEAAYIVGLRTRTSKAEDPPLEASDDESEDEASATPRGGRVRRYRFRSRRGPRAGGPRTAIVPLHRQAMVRARQAAAYHLPRQPRPRQRHVVTGPGN